MNAYIAQIYPSACLELLDEVERLNGRVGELTSEVGELLDETKLLRALLQALMEYTPRKQWRGGVENGEWVGSGEALCKVLDMCDAALNRSES